MILVTGAGGNVGSALLASLREQGVPACGAYHNPAHRGPDDVVMDFAAFSLPPGVSAVFLVAPLHPDQGAWELNVVREAIRAGIRVVKLSIWRADEGLTPIARLHQPAEQALRASGVPWTFLRPNFFQQNFLRQPSIRTSDVIASPAIHAAISFISTADIARVATHVLTNPGFDGHTLDLTGPAALTYAEAASVFSDVLGRPIRYVGLSDDEARSAMLAAGVSAFRVDAQLDVARAYRTGGADRVTTTVPDLTGHPAMSLAEFVHAHREVFS